MKALWTRLDWFIPLSLQGQATVLFVARLILLIMLVSIIAFASLSISIWFDILHREVPYYYGILVVIISLFVIRGLKHILLSDSSTSQSSVFPSFSPPNALRLIFLQRIALMIAVLLLPILIYACLYLSKSHVMMLIIDELILLGIILLISKGRIRLTLLIIIFSLYPICAVTPIVFTPMHGSILGIVSIFLGVAYSNTYTKIHIINVMMAIASMAIYKYLVHFHPTEAIYDTFWIDLLISITLLIVIILVFVFYQIERNRYSRHLEDFSAFLIQISNLNPHQLFVKDKDRQYQFTNSAFQANFPTNPRTKTLEEIIYRPSEAEPIKESDQRILTGTDHTHLSQTKITGWDEKEMWIETIKMPIKDTDGQIIGLLGISTDITSKRETEQALIESEERYRLIFENSPIGIAVDEKGIFRSVNQSFCDILGYTKTELEGMHISTIFPEQEREKIKQDIQKIAQRSRPYTENEFQVRKKDQSLRSILVGVRARFDSDDQYVETIASIIDISSKKEQEAMIQQQIETLNDKNRELEAYIESNLQLENFAFLASHDLKAPIRTIGSFAQLLNRSASDKLDSREKEFLEFIITASRNLYQLTQDLLSYARVNSEAHLFETLDLREMIDRILTDHQTIIQETGAKIMIDSKISTMIGSKSMIHQVFQNLISNALKFSTRTENPSVSIFLEKDTESEWQFGVTDNGIGIDPSYHDKIFQLFKKLNSADQYEGSGIGLALCKKIVELHQGSIWVESNPGKGTTFHFTISKSLPITELHSASLTGD